MRSRENNFDSVARFYDLLVGLIFGKSMLKAQISHFDQLPATGHALILGGGTGWIAEALFKARPQFHIMYVDASAKMLELAKKRFLPNEIRIKFICGTQDDIPDAAFDLIITNFFLDLFPDKELPKLLDGVKNLLVPGGSWIVTEFVNTKWWHRLMLTIMYRFFQYTSHIRAKRLPQWEQAMSTARLHEQDSKSFYGDFIQSKRYGLNE